MRLCARRRTRPRVLCVAYTYSVCAKYDRIVRRSHTHTHSGNLYLLYTHSHTNTFAHPTLVTHYSLAHNRWSPALTGLVPIPQPRIASMCRPSSITHHPPLSPHEIYYWLVPHVCATATMAASTTTTGWTVGVCVYICSLDARTFVCVRAMCRAPFTCDMLMIIYCSMCECECETVLVCIVCVCTRAQNTYKVQRIFYGSNTRA